MRNKYHPRVILIEDNGPALDLQAQFDTSACPVILLQPHGDKLLRLRRHIDLFQNGQIVLRAGAPFNDELIAECVGFPYGAHDDQVDSLTQFLEWIRSNDLPPIPPRLPVMGALSSVRRAREKLYWNAGRPSGPYVFSRR
jgi:phage terminase large subunit-like protein